jgi:hypothetical protein
MTRTIDFKWVYHSYLPSLQGREPTNNSTHMKYTSRGSNPRPIVTTAVRGERITAIPPMPPEHYPCHPNFGEFSSMGVGELEVYGSSPA